AQLVALTSGGPAVALRLPSESQIAAARQKQRVPAPTPGFGADAPKVHLASWSEDAPRTAEAEAALSAPRAAEPTAAAAYAPAIPQGAAPLSGLDPATIASIERLAAIEAGTR